MLKLLLNKMAILKGNLSTSDVHDKRYKNNDILTMSPWALTRSWSGWLYKQDDLQTK